MKFNLSQQSHLKGVKRDVVYNLDRILEHNLYNSDFGSGVETVWFGLIHYGRYTHMEDDFVDFITGRVVHKKYTRSKKELEIDFHLSYFESEACDVDQFLRLIERTVLMTKEEVMSMGIANFDVDELYKKLSECLADIPTASYLEQQAAQLPRRLSGPELFEKYPHLFNKPSGDSEKLAQHKLADNLFWGIVERSFISANQDVDDQLGFLLTELVQLDESDLYGFEITLREKIVEADHYHALALQEIAEGYVSDDSYLYFRCTLILNGKEAFEKVINHPKKLRVLVRLGATSEFLLSIADRAFEAKFGDGTDKEYPRSFAEGIISYNSTATKGKPIESEDLKKKLPNIWKMYRP